MFFNLKDKYQWKSQELQKKAKLFDSLTFVLAIACLAVYFSRVQSIIMLNLALLVGAGIFWYMSYSAKQKDKQIK